MALTPDTPNESFLREVDENLRRDQMRDFAKSYGMWLIAGVVLVLAAIAGWIYWQDRQKKQAAGQSEELSAIFTDIGSGRLNTAKPRLQALESADSDIVRASALLTEAAIALEANDRSTALAKYKALSDGGMPEAYQQLGLVRATALEFDSLKPEEVIARMQPLTKAGEPWFGAAGELTAMAYLKQGQRQPAARLFAQIAADRTVPETVRSRATQIAGTLGVDATAPPAATNQQE
ncbi:MAG: tetratricopeptide repeat protein [Sphingomonas sp.]|nr:tetratricopeptide repeat protein [Sphingomonas sp.]